MTILAKIASRIPWIRWRIVWHYKSGENGLNWTGWNFRSLKYIRKIHEMIEDVDFINGSIANEYLQTKGADFDGLLKIWETGKWLI